MCESCPVTLEMKLSAGVDHKPLTRTHHLTEIRFCVFVFCTYFFYLMHDNEDNLYLALSYNDP